MARTALPEIRPGRPGARVLRRLGAETPQAVVELLRQPHCCRAMDASAAAVSANARAGNPTVRVAVGHQGGGIAVIG
ncbi:MAG TPA: hypothetical protein VKG38_17935 [Solirubrobacteraceae bacterium]|nr:hypothetical protein [Solirubrobacteraceae bacterium]